MSVTSGFFNAIDHDRTYDANQMSEIFEGIIEDGVFEKVGDALAVKANPGSDDLNNMNVYVMTGRAWFNNRWIKNDSILPITIDTSELVLSRIDVVVVEVNKNDSVRACTIKVVKGTPASNPVAPTLTNTENVHQYPLAQVYVGAEVSAISQSNITSKIGTDDTPYVSGPLEVVSMEGHLAQWDQQFTDWLDGLSVILDGDVATNLANRMLALETEMTDTKKSVSEGKAKVANALTQVTGETVATTSTFDQLATFITTKVNVIKRGTYDYPDRRIDAAINIGFTPKCVMAKFTNSIGGFADATYGTMKSSEIYDLSIVTNGFNIRSERTGTLQYIAIK